MAPEVNSAARRLRILMGIPASGAKAGGPALHLPMLVEDLRTEARHEVATFAFGRRSEGEGMLKKIWHQWMESRRFPALLEREKPHLVHMNSAFDRKAVLRDLAFASKTRAHGLPLLIKWHGAELDLLAAKGFWGICVERLLQRVEAIAVLSQEEAGALRRYGYQGSVHVVRNGLQLERYQGRSDVRRRLGIADGTPLLLHIARQLPSKGLRQTVQAFAEIDPKHKARLVVVGDGPERRPCEELSRELGVASRVHFLGAMSEDEALDFYRGCDLLVFPTYHAEGFPMAIFQSLAAGLGIVTTRIRAAADYLEEPKNCLFTPPRDPNQLAKRLATLLEQPQLLAEMRHNNMALSQRFDRKRIAREFAEIYRMVLS